MSTFITEECINCGACEPECPNTAIYAAAIEYELNGARSAALSNDFFYIVPEKCSECVGFFDHEACAAVCPVDCCVPDPKLPETEEALLARARALHPDKSFAEPLPSRFRKQRPTSAAAIAADLGAATADPPAAEPQAAPVAAKAAPAAAGSAAVAAPAPAAAKPAVSVAAAGASKAPAPPQAAAPQQAAASTPAAAEKKQADAVPVAKSASAEAAVPEPAAQTAAQRGPLDDVTVPVLCRNCQAEYAVPVRLFVPGANLRCTHCRASHGPTQEHFLLVQRRLRRYSADLRGGGRREQLHDALQRDLRAVSTKLLARPRRSLLGLS